MAATTGNSGVIFTIDGAIYTVGNGNVVHYQRIDGIYYHIETPASVVEVLEQSRQCRKRIRVYYGDKVTGRDWLEEHDVEGCVGNSMGPLKVPLLVHNRRSHGGPAVLDRCIVKIKEAGKTGNTLFQHPSYHTGTFAIREIGPSDDCGGINLVAKGYTHAVHVNGTNHANFRSRQAAERFVAKMTG